MNINRVQWMGSQGRKLFSKWTAELLHESNTPAFWQSYRDSLVEEFPGVKTSGVVLGPDDIVRRLTSEFGGALTKMEVRLGIGRDILLPYKNEILRYTSAADRIARNGLSPEDAVLVNARDSLRYRDRL